MHGDATERAGAADRGGRRDRPRLLFLVTEDWYFWSHRLALAEAALAAGYAVSLATRVRDHGAAIRDRGIALYPLDWSRGETSPAALLGDVRSIAAIYRSIRPDIVHHIAIKPAVLGGLAAMVAGVPRVAATLAGRGMMLSGDGLGARLAGAGVRSLLRAVAVGRRSALIVQNADDAAWAGRLPAVPGVTLIRGSGVDIARYAPLPEPDGPLVVAQASRMLRIKGVAELVEAVCRLRAGGLRLELLLAGDSDPGSHAAVPPALLEEWGQRDGITWLGQVADVRTVWSRAHVAVQASLGGEGVPKALLEAAACGRPLVATDVPGNREVVRPGETGLLAAPGNPAALAEALRRLALDPAGRRRMGSAARALVEGEFATPSVNAQTLDVYRRLMGGP